ncbi:MAG: AAA family ATPase [Candidatus Aminicenantes bacterium]|nr:AAA family ATPase [Candidatus Aminicenantes bacterium]
MNVLNPYRNRGSFWPDPKFFSKLIKSAEAKPKKGFFSSILAFFRSVSKKKFPTPIFSGIKKIPYGLSDYERIRKENYYYVDKTMYLRKLEETGEYLFFLRPRRFGKSLFLSMLETYYDIAREDEFELFFKGTDIFENPTGERNRYLVLKFNFSTVNPAADKVEDSFFHHIKETVILFLEKYSAYLPGGKERLLKKADETSAFDLLSELIGLCRNAKRRIYLVIDEYDNFANTILSSVGAHDYKKLTHGVGFLRVFFNKIKEGASGSGAPIMRLFVTGVSPLTMDDVTSGFNIGKNITLYEEFNRMLGFTGGDVDRMLEHYENREPGKKPLAANKGIMTEWYDNYKFSKTAKDRSVYNSDMVLYFIERYLREKSVPDELIDFNVKIDYDKIRYLIVSDTGEKRNLNGNFSKLKCIVENGGISSKLVESFPAEKLLHPDNFISLLFYHGLLTIDRIEMDKLRLVIPNETVRRLYYEFIKESYGEMNIFNIDLHTFSGLMSEMAYKGKWEPLFEYIASLMRDSMSLRDFITGEKSVQAFLNVYLGLFELYNIHPERELNKGYADIVMEPFTAKYEGIKYSYLLELKYMDKKARKSKIKQLRAEAEEQLRTYAMDKNFKKTIKKTTLIKLVLIFQGAELVYLGEAGKENKKGD